MSNLLWKEVIPSLFRSYLPNYLAELAPSLPEDGSPGQKTIREFVYANAQALWKNARTDTNQINAYWHESERKPIYNAITQTSGLNLLNAAVLLSR